MKIIFIFGCLVAALFMHSVVMGQNFTMKKDTIITNKKPYALLTTAPNNKLAIRSLDGKDLIEVHKSYIDDKTKMLYVIHFLSDNRKGIMKGDNKNFPKPIIETIIKYGLLNNGSVNDSSENAYLKLFPLPAGYTDISERIEY